MATQISAVEYILDQLEQAPTMRYRKMFGEYALYCNDKVVALVCDDALFVKLTEDGKSFAGDRYAEGLPYPGAKPWLAVDMEYVEDREWLCELIRLTEEALPLPKPKIKSAIK